MNSSIDEITRQGGKEPSRKEPTLNPPPKIEKSALGVTSNYILNKRYSDDEREDKWYALRIRYNHDEDAYKELLSAQIKKAYFATHQVVKLVHGKRKKMKAPLIPGLLFAFSSRMELDYFMFGKSPMAVHVRYYRNRSTGKDEQGYNDPVTVPELEMDSFMKICDADNPYVQVIPLEKQQHIRKGDWVRVIGGPFKDVIGRTAIVKRQRCVLVDLQGICSRSTAFATMKSRTSNSVPATFSFTRRLGEDLLRAFDVLLFVSPSFHVAKPSVSHCETTGIKVRNHRY